jgi:hypothetical protein
VSAHASSAELGEVAQLLEGSGVRARVEAQLAAYLDEARAALNGAPLMAAGVGMLDDLLARIGKRDR